MLTGSRRQPPRHRRTERSIQIAASNCHWTLVQRIMLHLMVLSPRKIAVFSEKYCQQSTVTPPGLLPVSVALKTWSPRQSYCRSLKLGEGFSCLKLPSGWTNGVFCSKFVSSVWQHAIAGYSRIRMSLAPTPNTCLVNATLLGHRKSSGTGSLTKP